MGRFSQYLMLFATAVGLAVSQTMIKRGLALDGPITLASVADLGALIKRVLTTPLLFGGYAVSGVTALLWVVVLSRWDLSYAFPILNGLFYLCLVAVAVVWLDEPLTPARGLGIALVAIGITVLVLAGKS